jgi:hypothetical protein
MCVWEIGARRGPLSLIRHSTRRTPFVLSAIEATRSWRSGGRCPSRIAVPSSTRTESEGTPRVRGSFASVVRRRASATTSSRFAVDGGTARQAKPSHRPSSRRFFQAQIPAVARPIGSNLHNPAIVRPRFFASSQSYSSRTLDPWAPNPHARCFSWWRAGAAKQRPIASDGRESQGALRVRPCLAPFRRVSPRGLVSPRASRRRPRRGRERGAVSSQPSRTSAGRRRGTGRSASARTPSTGGGSR